MIATLQEALLKAHESDDRNALISGYTEAAEAQADVDAKCFFLTHAYVYALEVGDPRSLDLRLLLQQYGREPDTGDCGH